MFTPKQYVDMIMEPRELERLIDEALRNGLLTVCLGQYRSEVAINAVLARALEVASYMEDLDRLPQGIESAIEAEVAAEG